MRYSIIAAMCSGGGIGNNGDIPWDIPEEVRFFSRTTKGKGNNAVIMGRTTWESLPHRPLCGRVNIVLSRDKDYMTDDAEIFHNIRSLDRYCSSQRFDEAWIIGGAEVYKEFLERKIVNKCVLTFINKLYPFDRRMPALGVGWTVNESNPLAVEQDIKIDVIELTRVLDTSSDIS